MPNSTDIATAAIMNIKVRIHEPKAETDLRTVHGSGQKVSRRKDSRVIFKWKNLFEMGKTKEIFFMEYNSNLEIGLAPILYPLS